MTTEPPFIHKERHMQSLHIAKSFEIVGNFVSMSMENIIDHSREEISCRPDKRFPPDFQIITMISPCSLVIKLRMTSFSQTKSTQRAYVPLAASYLSLLSSPGYRLLGNYIPSAILQQQQHCIKPGSIMSLKLTQYYPNVDTGYNTT